MDLTHHSLPKGLVFTARIILGSAIPVVGISLGSWGLNSSGSYAFLAVPIIAGLIAGYILKKHFTWALSWALLIPIGYIIVPQLFGGSDENAEFDFAGFFLIVVVFPTYLGAFIGYLISKSIGRRRTRPQ